MEYTLKQLIEHVSECQALLNGKWVPARPMSGPFMWRVKAAWHVLIGKADAFTWPEAQ